MRAGYVEGVRSGADRRRRGYATAMMSVLADAIRSAYQLRGLEWRRSTWALTAGGRRRTPDEVDGHFLLIDGAPRDLHSDIARDWREGDVR